MNKRTFLKGLGALGASSLLSPLESIANEADIELPVTAIKEIKDKGGIIELNQGAIVVYQRDSDMERYGSVADSIRRSMDKGRHRYLSVSGGEFGLASRHYIIPASHPNQLPILNRQALREISGKGGLVIVNSPDFVSALQGDGAMTKHGPIVPLIREYAGPQNIKYNITQSGGHVGQNSIYHTILK